MVAKPPPFERLADTAPPERSWKPESAVEEVFNCWQSRGVRFIVFNVFERSSGGHIPSDVDILLDPATVDTARASLQGLGFYELTLTLGPMQSVWWRYDVSTGWVRLHLHYDLNFLGVSFIHYDAAASCVREHCGVLVPDWYLQYWLLVLQWFSRAKHRYRPWIAQLHETLDNNRLSDIGASLLGEHRRLAERAERLCLSEAAVSRAHPIAMTLLSLPGQAAVWRHMITRTGGWLRCRISRPRRGLLVFLMGVDGSGKTTLARSLEQVCRQGGPVCYSLYLGLKNSAPQRIKALFARKVRVEDNNVSPGAYQWIGRRSKTLANVFNIVLNLSYVLDYQVRLWSIRRLLTRPDSLVVVDRAYYDRLADISRPGNKLCFYALPRPDLVLFLSGDVKSLHSRKPEFAPGQLHALQAGLAAAVDWLECHGCKCEVIDTTAIEKEQTAQAAMIAIWRVLAESKPVRGEAE